MKRLLTLVAALTLCPAASGQDDAKDDDAGADYVAADRDRFNFFNGCDRIAQYVAISAEESPNQQRN